MPQSNCRTLDEVKALFRQEGVSITEWAAANDVEPHHVYALLNGQSKGLRGDSHKVAVKLGLKPLSTGALNMK